MDPKDKKITILKKAASLADISQQGTKMGPKYASLSIAEEMADDFDITDQIEIWMKQRNLDFDNVEHRKKFLMEFIDEQKVNHQRLKSRIDLDPRQGSPSPVHAANVSIYERVMNG